MRLVGGRYRMLRKNPIKIFKLRGRT